MATVSENNKTGMSYAQWKAIQDQYGQPSSYQDWQNASAPPQMANGPAFSKVEMPTVKSDFGTLKFTKPNGEVGTIDLNASLSKFLEQAQRGDMFGTKWGNQYWGLPADLGMDPRGDYPFKGGIDWDRFENPAEAKAIFEPYLNLTQQVFAKGSELQSQAKSKYGSWNNGYARNEFKQGLQEYLNNDFAQNKNIQIQKVNENLSSHYGVNPSTGQPLTKSQAYEMARQANGGSLSFNDFDKNPDQYLQKAGLQTTQSYEASKTNSNTGSLNNAQEITDLLNGKTVSEANKTGMSYTIWKAIQDKNGQPSSYQDWLKAEGPPEGYAQNTSQTGSINDSTKSALDVLENSPFFQNLPEDQKALLRMTVKSWDPTAEVNMDNVLKEFDKIKSGTIDPYFKEQVDVFSNDVKDQWNTLQMNRGMELEQERSIGGQNIRQARSDLEASGMTFSGQGIEQLGNKSAYAQPGQNPNSAIPNQTAVGDSEDLTQKGGMTFTDGRFFEGTVNQANRLMSTSSAQRYMENVRRLGRSVEDVLGGSTAASMVQGYSPAGVSKGSLNESKDQQYAQTLSQLSGQQAQNNEYKQPVDFTSFNNQFS